MDCTISDPAPKTNIAIKDNMASIASKMRYCSTGVYQVSAKIKPATIAIGTQRMSGKPINKDKVKINVAMPLSWNKKKAVSGTMPVMMPARK